MFMIFIEMNFFRESDFQKNLKESFLTKNNNELVPKFTIKTILILKYYV